MLVRGFEESAETHFVCVNCKTGVKVEANEFRHRLATRIPGEYAASPRLFTLLCNLLILLVGGRRLEVGPIDKQSA